MGDGSSPVDSDYHLGWADRAQARPKPYMPNEANSESGCPLLISHRMSAPSGSKSNTRKVSAEDELTLQVEDMTDRSCRAKADSKKLIGAREERACHAVTNSHVSVPSRLPKAGPTRRDGGATPLRSCSHHSPPLPPPFSSNRLFYRAWVLSEGPGANS